MYRIGLDLAHGPFGRSRIAAKQKASNEVRIDTTIITYLLIYVMLLITGIL